MFLLDVYYNATLVVSGRARGPKEEREEWEIQDRWGASHHLVVFPVTEEVHRSVSPALDDGPASVVYFLLTPDLHLPLQLVWLDQVHAAGAVASFMRLVTVSEQAWRKEKWKAEIGGQDDWSWLGMREESMWQGLEVVKSSKINVFLGAINNRISDIQADQDEPVSKVIKITITSVKVSKLAQG